MYKNSQLPIIWATMARRSDLRVFERGLPKGVCVGHQISTDLNNSGAVPETVFSTINKTPNDGIYCGRMVLHPSKIVPNTCRIYPKAHLSCSGFRWPKRPTDTVGLSETFSKQDLDLFSKSVTSAAGCIGWNRLWMTFPILLI